MKPTILVSVIILAVGGTSAVADAANGWNHKALNDERQASAMVGGFSQSGARYYHDGVVYLRGNGIKVGSKTISDVVGLGKHHSDSPHRTPAHERAGAGSQPSAGGFGAGLAWLTIIGVVIFALTRKRRASSGAVPTSTGPSVY